MMILNTISQLNSIVDQAKREGKSIGLVPTMGFLHEGHLALANAAKEENELVIMSIFVNPTQFGPNEDFQTYPRDLKRDTQLAESAGVDIIFAPSVEEMYPENGGISIKAGRQSEILCGASRPGHFDGVLQVVTKLFHIAQPTRAYFGQKDAQQVAIIQTLVRDYNFPLEIRSLPIVREADGLAKSSRNVYLTEQERSEAPAIYEALIKAKEEFLVNRNANAAIELASNHITRNSSGKIDYIELLAYPDLKEVTGDTNHFLLASAVFIGKTRLIDNIIFSFEGETANV
ncbi:pantoate--beta-alanine ligase [Ureibacillus sinduriensis]|uniref:Pantothenate synthetase n=1 Tax=Ureibacillus sinduriensis BLB-1 = JCM 15800 TaxID=1384057 RepID=A0A0A3HV27_9BACL|nr:pantoate--beta-alanine ligase [Ureibacillus sinduriensis]KGR74163.1 pantoate--beta-alanine ligase [Ureibacillus sinduriensis BLB-1 = JCM 15800]